MTDAARYRAYRRSILPIKLAAARATLRHLEAEALRLGLAQPSLVPAPPPGRNGAAAPAPSAAAPLGEGR